MRPRPDHDREGTPRVGPATGAHGSDPVTDHGRVTTERSPLLILIVVVVLVLLGIGVALAVLQAQHRQSLQDRFAMRAQLAASYVALELDQQARWLDAQAEARLAEGALDASGFAVAVRASPVRAGAILDAAGRERARVPEDAGLCATLLDPAAPHLVAAADGRTGVSDRTVCPSAPEPVIALALPIGEHGRPQALHYVAALPVDSLGLQAYLDEAVELYGGDGYVVDGQGAVLAATGDAPASLGADHDPGLATLATLAPDLDAAVAEAPAGAVERDGVAARYQAVTVPGGPWQLVLVASRERLLAPAAGWSVAGPWVAYGLLVLVSGASLGLLRDALRSRGRVAAAHAALTEANAELARSNRDLEQFAYAASHDLQEPLRKVASYTELLARRYQGRLDDDADEFMAYAVDGARRMQRLIQDLLTYSRVRQATERTAVDLASVTKAALDALGPALEERGATVTVGALPAVRGDPAALTRLLQNLVGNAIKFVEGRAPTVAIDAEAADGVVRLTVRDNGIGIAPEHLERIFDLFERLGAREAYPGTGLGLSICRRIVEAHGGRIWATSTVGEGTTVHVELPAAPTPGTPDAGEQATSAPATLAARPRTGGSP